MTHTGVSLRPRAQVSDRNSIADLYSVGKTVYICIVLMVNVEVRHPAAAAVAALPPHPTHPPRC